MLQIAFWYEFRRRADVILWVALINPILLALYALSEEISRPALEFWLIGLGVTFVACAVAFAVMYAVTARSVNSSLKSVLHEKMWIDTKADAWPVVRNAPTSQGKNLNRR